MDWTVLDLEHGAATEADLLALLYAVGTTPMAAIVRPQSAERLRVGRALDLGAAGIMLPQLQSIEQVREAVSFLRYPPVGVARRGPADARRRAWARSSHADVARVVNERIVGIVQIESVGAGRGRRRDRRLDEVDVLFVGPADLSHALGVPGRFDDPTYLDALRTVVAATKRHGKAAGILLYDAAGFERHLELGFRFIGLGSEGSFVSAGPPRCSRPPAAAARRPPRAGRA